MLTVVSNVYVPEVVEKMTYPPLILDGDMVPGDDRVTDDEIVTGLSFMYSLPTEGSIRIVSDEEPIHTTPEVVTVVLVPPIMTMLVCIDDAPTVPDAHTVAHPFPLTVIEDDDPEMTVDPLPGSVTEDDVPPMAVECNPERDTVFDELISSADPMTCTFVPSVPMVVGPFTSYVIILTSQ